MNTNVSAIVITFHPDPDHLMDMINTLRSQVQRIIIINNGPVFHLAKGDDVVFEVFNLSENMGIGHATNIGLRIALERQSSHILVCDQDTTFPIGYVDSLLETMSPECSVLVPNYYDTISNTSAKRFAIKSHLESSVVTSKERVPVSQAIASGMLIKRHVFDEGIIFNEKLFIDWVDFEWCWRVRKAGMTIEMRTDIFLEHRLGSYSRKIFKKFVNIRSADRHYYITRNAVYLSLYCPFLRLPFRVKLFAKALLFLFGYPMLGKPFLSNGHATSLGFFHGLIGKLGPITKGFL